MTTIKLMISMDQDLLRMIDSVVGSKKDGANRSAWIAEACNQRLKRGE